MRQFFFLLMVCAAGLRADVVDQASDFQNLLRQINLDVVAFRSVDKTWQELEAQRAILAENARDPVAAELWSRKLRPPGDDLIAAASLAGGTEGNFQHAACLEMLAAARSGDAIKAREWRAVIALPRRANTMKGLKALQGTLEDEQARQEAVKLLAREYLTWQVTRVKQKSASLLQLAKAKRANPFLVAARSSEIYALSRFPREILDLVVDQKEVDPGAEIRRAKAYRSIQAHLGQDQILPEKLVEFRSSMEAGMPNLLGSDDVVRLEALILKLKPWLVKEYREGIRDGKVINAVEFQKAKTVLSEIQQAVSDLLPIWSARSKVSSRRILEITDQLQNIFDQRGDPATVAEMAFQLELAAKAQRTNVLTPPPTLRQ